MMPNSDNKKERLRARPFSEYAIIPGSCNAVASNDNIAFAIKEIPKGIKLRLGSQVIYAMKKIDARNNFSIKNIYKGGKIISLGVPIGKSRRTISSGKPLIDVDVAKLKGNSVLKSAYSYCKPAGLSEIEAGFAKRTFKGFKREVTKAGKVGGGTENLVVILSTVKCSKAAVENIAYCARQKFLKSYPNITNILAITHEYGCGMPRERAVEELKKVMIRIVNHPNVAATLLIGLGCEVMNIARAMPDNILTALERETIDFKNRILVDYLQRYTSESAATKSIVNGPLKDLLRYANTFEREPLPLSYLTLGLKCGGSDRLSGICANPVMGVVTDLLVRAGGAAIITETTEMEGCEYLLAERARDRSTKQWLCGLTKRFNLMSRNYPIPGSGTQQISPGNKAGGLINILLKSAGAQAKSGRSVIEGGLEYLDSIYKYKKRGLWVLDCPSYDQISTPALSLSGAQIIAFSTGLGTPIGSGLSQLVKIGNSKEMGLRDHVDFFCEKVLRGRSIREVGEQLFEFIISVASGDKLTRAEEIDRKMLSDNLPGLHHEFMIWKRWPDI